MADGIKIFLSYHKSTPIYKSDFFLPIKVGKGTLPDCISDSAGDNISELNPYYCELTGHYWVLKNYLNKADEKYIGFAHYRRLPDLNNISETDTPAIYGLNYSESVELFADLNKSDLYKQCSKYDIILPCTCYMYGCTVNPILRDDEEHFNTYEHFKKEHKNDLLNIVREVIKENHPEYTDPMEMCFSAEKSHFYNIYVMKKDLLKDYLDFMFEILEKTGEKIGGWEQEKYKRMAGFVGETLINIWLNKHTSLKIGYVPIYMIDFEAEYIQNANKYHSEGRFEKEIDELKKLLEVTTDKFSVSFALLLAELNTGQEDSIREYLGLSKAHSQNSDNYYDIAAVLPQDKYKTEICELYKNAISLSQKNKFYAKSYLKFAENVHDADITKDAWEHLQWYDLTPEEQKEYEHFKKIYEMIKG
ncbi:MAG: DUF4422 domain-containing protein [Cyanobacteria bacterium RUI128]|nr:DUF4422 domain-containing protein [Cyanobacteria bacterium RUI128]